MAHRPPQRRRSAFLLAVVLLMLSMAAGPAGATEEDDRTAPIRMARPTWDTGWFQAEIYKQLLGDLGYEVDGPVTMDNDEFYRAVAAGDVDFWASGWFPLHQQYLDEDVEDAIEIVGTEVEAGALQGYLIDRATAEQRNITNLEALRDPDVAALFDVDGNGTADLIGCNVEWACADVVDHQLEAYGLSATVEQIQGDYSLLMVEAIDRYEAGEPVLFYTFTPNWTVGELVPGADVRWLETPFPSVPPGQTLEPGSTEIAGWPDAPPTRARRGGPPTTSELSRTGTSWMPDRRRPRCWRPWRSPSVTSSSRTRGWSPVRAILPTSSARPDRGSIATPARSASGSRPLTLLPCRTWRVGPDRPTLRAGSTRSGWPPGRSRRSSSTRTGPSTASRWSWSTSSPTSSASTTSCTA